jgi:hypothetical protein
MMEDDRNLKKKNGGPSLVWLDGLGGVDHKHQWRVDHLVVTDQTNIFVIY